MVLYSVLKILIFSFNCVTFLGGTALFGMGVWIKVDAGYVFVILWNIAVPLKVVENVSYLCILIGSLLIIIGFLACYGARKENKYMLLTFFLVMLVIFLAQLVAGVIFMLFTSLSEVLMGHIQNWFQNFFKNDYGREKEITDTFDSLMGKKLSCPVHKNTPDGCIMKELHQPQHYSSVDHGLQSKGPRLDVNGRNPFKCCGTTGYIDFVNSYFTNTTNTYPRSCCFGSGSCIIPHGMKGCKKVLRNFLWKNLTLFGMFALGTALFEAYSVNHRINERLPPNRTNNQCEKDNKLCNKYQEQEMKSP